MPNRTRTAPRRWTSDPSFIPLPHPSWSEDVPLAELGQPLIAAEFWKRLGL